MEAIIQLQDVSKEFKVLNRREGLKGSLQDLFSRDYKIIKAVNNISMDIMPGEIVGYLGPNGAGKSTTIKMMTGVLKPSSGTILCNNVVPYEKRSENAQNIGVVFGQRSQLWWALPAIESFKILKDIYQVEDKAYQDMMDLYASMVDMESLMHKPVRQMSLGQRTLCDILAAFLHNPGVVFLDEPTIGLDVAMKAKIRELVQTLNKEKNTTVILTTHDMGDVDALCERIVIIDKGTMLYDNDIQHLTELFGAYRTLSLSLVKSGKDVTEEKMNALVNSVEQTLCHRFDIQSGQAESGKQEEMTISVTKNEDQIEVLVDESKTNIIDVLNAIQKEHRIYDMHLQEISTESVIKKIYEGGLV
ncbi:MAG: ATP-binding cassette domain-containing protein [Lachnospiraceae bacterium]|nr:ATP-binding cassette domain-containing protein [Lachnospiraceae bacterium]